MSATVDLRALHISDHAADQYTERVIGERVATTPPALRSQRKRAKTCIGARLRYAIALPDPGMHDGFPQRAWRLEDCVITEKNRCVTTVLTEAMYARGLRSDT